MSENKNAVGRVAEEVVTNLATDLVRGVGSWIGKVAEDVFKPKPSTEEKELLKPKE